MSLENEGIDLTLPIDPLEMCSTAIGAPNRFYSHGVEQAQIDAAELILQHILPPEADEAGRFTTEEDPRRVRAIQFLRGVAQGLGQGGVSARVRAIKVMLNGGVS